MNSDTYTKIIDTADRELYDIYVKSGNNGRHVLFFTGVGDDGDIKTRESTTEKPEKVRAITKDKTALSGFTLRRFNGW